MTEHNHISTEEFAILEDQISGLSSDQELDVINHLRFSGQHQPEFQGNDRLNNDSVGIQYRNQLRAHKAALLRGEITIKDLE